MSYLLSIGQRVRYFRRRAKMSQETLAKKCNYISRSSINKIELGYTDMPILKIITLADALGVSPVELLLPVDPNSYTENEKLLYAFYGHSPDVRAYVDGIFEISKGDEFSAAYIEALKAANLVSEEIIKAIESAPESDETLMRDEE